MPEIFIFQSSFQEVDLMHVGLMRETPYLPRFTNKKPPTKNDSLKVVTGKKKDSKNVRRKM